MDFLKQPEWVFWIGVFKVIFGFALIIGIHEFGHALAAWLAKIPIQKFSIGMGPGLTFRNVPIVNELVLSPIVIGGFVMVDNAEVEKKNFFQRLLFYSGGMLMNVITAAVLVALIGGNFFKALLAFTWFWLAGWPMFISMLISGQVNASESVSGPVGISQMLANNGGAGNSFAAYIWVVAILNVAIAMMNLLPLPPLDGGHILKLFAEKIIGQKAALVMHKGLMFVGVALLIFILVFATFNDVKRIF